jgi:hypothetical protein
MPPASPTDPAPDSSIDPAALDRAEAALDRLTARYLEWAERDLASLEDFVGQLRGDPDGVARGVAAVFSIAHDMKGQGATFGYPLVSELTSRICRMTESNQPPDLERLDRLMAALGRVIRQRLAGEGDEPIRRQLADGDL